MVEGLIGIAGVVIGGLISWWLQKDRASTDVKIALEAVKTEHMAERAARHYLEHDAFTDRSFEVISRHLGGFEDDELRRILVRAGAVRVYGKDGKELWRLLSRDGDAVADVRGDD